MTQSIKTNRDLLYPRLELKPGTESWGLIQQLISTPVSKLPDKALVNELELMLEYGNIGGKASSEHCESLNEGLIKIAIKHGLPTPPKNTQKREADAEMGEFLHRNMRISRNEASHDGVWNAMSCCICPKVVGWRWSSEATAVEDVEVGENVSIPDRWFTQSKSERHALGRLWWRAELLNDDVAKDPYWIVSSLMEDELVQCTERSLFVTHSEAILCLAKKHLMETNSRDSNGPRTRIFRQAIKNLLRMASVVDLDTATKANHLESLVDTSYSEALATII
jgi:hypothetical protein